MGWRPAERGANLCLRHLLSILAAAAMMIAWLPVQAQGGLGFWVIILHRGTATTESTELVQAASQQQRTVLTAAATRLLPQCYLDPRHADSGLGRHRCVAQLLQFRRFGKGFSTIVLVLSVALCLPATFLQPRTGLMNDIHIPLSLIAAMPVFLQGAAIQPRR
jgi:hypothetical protein